MTDKTHRTWGFNCFECKKPVHARKSYLYDDKAKDYRCKDCWNIYIEKETNNELETTV